VGGFLMSIADPTTTAIRVQSIDFYGLPKNYYEKLASAYSATKSDDVLRLAQKYLDMNNLAIVVVGKASEVKSKLEKFGPVEVWNSDLKPVGGGDAIKGSTPKTSGIDAAQTWDKMLTAMGGKKKLRAVKSIQTSGTLTSSITGEGKLTKVEVAPNRVYQTFTLGSVHQDMIVDNNTVRMGRGGALTSVEGEGHDQTLEDSHILPEAYIEDQHATLGTAEKRDFRGQPAIAVELTYPINGTVVYYLDPKTYLPMAQESDARGTLVYSDWKPEGGIMLAHTQTLEPQAGVVLKLSIVKYTVNGKVDESLFKKK